jgi:hypothetical protein
MAILARGRMPDYREPRPGGPPMAMRQVTKEQFKECFLRYSQPGDGYGPEYWDRFFGKPDASPIRYLVEEPQSPEHCRLMLVTGAGECRLFFMTEEAEERFFEFPGGKD